MMDFKLILTGSLVVMAMVSLIVYSFLCYTVYSDAANGKTVFDAHQWLFYSNIILSAVAAGLSVANFLKR